MCAQQCRVDANLYTISQTLDSTLFEKMMQYKVLMDYECKTEPTDRLKQLTLFDF